MKKEIYIMGHLNPDADSIVSSILLKNILTSKGISCECGVFEGDRVDENVWQNISLYASYDPVVIKKEDAKNHNYFLVDHNDISLVIKDKDCVLGIFDHHQNIGWDENDIKYQFSDRCSTSIFLYEFFKDTYSFSIPQKELILLGLAYDSRFGKSQRYKLTDEELAKSLRLGKMPEDLFHSCFKESDITPEKILLNNRKTLNLNDKQYESCLVERIDGSGFKPAYDALQKDTNPNFIAMISNFTEQTTTVIIKEDGEIKQFKNFDVLYSRKDLVNEFDKITNIDKKDLNKETISHSRDFSRE